MNYILENFDVIAKYAPLALGVGLVLILLFFAINSRSVYASLNKRTARCARRLKKPTKKETASMKRLPCPTNTTLNSNRTKRAWTAIRRSF